MGWEFHYSYCKVFMQCLTSQKTVEKVLSAIIYRPFHNTLPRSSEFVNWILVRFYETDCRRRGLIRQYIVEEVYNKEHVKKKLA